MVVVVVEGELYRVSLDDEGEVVGVTRAQGQVPHTVGQKEVAVVTKEAVHSICILNVELVPVQP